jgi:hypothetical protein
MPSAGFRPTPFERRLSYNEARLPAETSPQARMLLEEGRARALSLVQPRDR